MASFYYSPQVAALAAQTRSRLGLSDTPADWAYKDRQQYNNLIASELAAHPEIYGKAAEVAARYTPESGDLEKYGFFDMVGDFGAEVGNNISKAIPTPSKINNTITTAIFLVVIGFGIYLFVLVRGAKP